MIDGVGLVVCLVRFECLLICHGSPFQISVTSADVYLNLLLPTQHNQPLSHCHEFPQILPWVKFTVIFSWLCVLWWQNSVLTYLDSDVRSWLMSGLCSKMFTTCSVANLCKYKSTKSFWLSREWFPKFLNTEMLEEQFPIQPHHDFECSLLLGLFECTSEENAALIIP